MKEYKSPKAEFLPLADIITSSVDELPEFCAVCEQAFEVPDPTFEQEAVCVTTYSMAALQNQPGI